MPLRHPLNLFDVEILTERLCLKPCAEVWLQDCYREFTPEVTRYMASAPLDSLEEVRERLNDIHQSMTADRHLGFDILTREQTEFLGRGGIDALDSETPRIGLWFKQAAQGQGYGKEFVLALKQWAMSHLECDYLLYRTDRANRASLKLAQALGGRELTQYERTSASGRVLQVIEYRVDLTD